MDEDNQKKGRLMVLLGSIISSIGCSAPFLFLAVLAAVLMLLGLFDEGDDSVSKNCISIKSTNEICSSVTVAGYGTMSLDDYVAGVVEHEFNSASPETMKAQAIAARSYGLAGADKDSKGNCSIGDTSQGFQTFDPNPSQNAINAANETSGMILVDENGNVVSSEYSSNSLPAPYDSYGDMITMSERDLQIPRTWWDSHKTCDSSTLNSIHVQENGVIEKDAYGRVVYGCGHGRGMGQIAAWYLDLVKGYTYEQILDYFYGPDSVYNWSLASAKGATTNCTYSSNGDLETLDHYTMNHEGLKVFDHKLLDIEKDSLNNYLKQELEKAGHGTGVAVAAVGQALVYWFEKNGGYYLQYRWGGGHYDEYTTNGGCDLGGSFIYANPNWGSTDCGYDEHDSSRKNYGMDCSGFVSWATRTACNANFGAHVSGDWVSYGKQISLSEAVPGDVIADGNHIQLVVKRDGDGVIVAEEGGASGSVGSGLVFNRITESSGYRPSYVISMKNYYANNCTDIRKGTGSSGSSSSKDGKSTGKGKILLIAGHSYPEYCNKVNNECRPVPKTECPTLSYYEPNETRNLVQLIKKSLINEGYKKSDIDIVNELLGEDFGDTSTSKSLFVEESTNHKELIKNINFSQYKYAIEIHFNASTNCGGGTKKGVLSFCYGSSCGLKINSAIRSAVNGVLGNGDNGELEQELVDLKLLGGVTESSINVPFTYLETEFYDNDSVMNNYKDKEKDVAKAIAKAIKKYYPK